MRSSLILGLFLAASLCRVLNSGPADPQPTSKSVRSTATVTPRPAATATLPPPPRTFTEEFESRPAYWVAFQTNGSAPDIQAQDGSLLFRLREPNAWVYALYGGPDYQAVRVEASVENRASEDAALGLICHYHESEGWYEFDVFGDQTFVILYARWLADGVARYIPIYRGESSKIRRSGTNELVMLCSANTVTVFANGAQLRKVEDKRYGLQAGKIGLAVASYESVPVLAAFDWVRVSEP